MNKDRVRKILLDNGFTIKEGCDDLKPYVYRAATELFTEASYVPCAVPQAALPQSSDMGPAWLDGFEVGTATLRLAIQSVAGQLVAACISGPQTMCVCGKPKSPGVFHRTDGPCHAIEPDMERVGAQSVSEGEVRRKMQYMEGKQDGSA